MSFPSLRIDLPLFGRQRSLLTKIADLLRRNLPYVPADDDGDLLAGLLELTDAIYDLAIEQKGELLTVPRIVLNLSGGVLQDVFSSEPRARVILVDWATKDANPAEEDMVAIPDGRGNKAFAAVAEYPLHSLPDLAGTDVEDALDAAKIDIGLCECEKPGFYYSGVPGILRGSEKTASWPSEQKLSDAIYASATPPMRPHFKRLWNSACVSHPLFADEFSFPSA